MALCNLWVVWAGVASTWGRVVWAWQACGLALRKVKTHFLPSPVTCVVFVTDSGANDASSLALRYLLALERKSSWNASYLCYLSISDHFIKIFGASGLNHLFCNLEATLSIYLSLEDSLWICRKVKWSDSKSNFLLQFLHVLLFSGQLLWLFSVPLFLQHAHLFVVGSEAPHCSVSQNCPALKSLLHNTASEMGFGCQSPWPLPDSIQMQFCTSSV